MLAAILARQVDFLILVKHGIYDSARRNSRNQRYKSLRICGIGLSLLVQQEGQEARTLASSFRCGVMLLDDFQDARPAFFGRGTVDLESGHVSRAAYVGMVRGNDLRDDSVVRAHCSPIAQER